MRNMVLSNSPRVRLSLLFVGIMLAALVFAGCGGGGGSSAPDTGGPPAGDPTLATVIGRVVDTSSSHAPVQGATVTVIGTGRSAITRADGSFTITNVPLTATQFTVASPDPFTYYNYAQYQSKQYDTTKCNMPLPTLAKGQNATSDVFLYNGGQNPPPPPPVGGCP